MMAENFPIHHGAYSRRFEYPTYGGATRSRTGLNGFAIKQAFGAKGSLPGDFSRADRFERLFRVELSKKFPVRTGTTSRLTFSLLT